MKTATLLKEPTPADLLANARHARDNAREHVTALEATGRRVGELHTRLQAAKQAVATLTQQHAQAVQEWASAGATGTPPQPDAKALQAAHAELAAAQQQADAAGVAMKQVEAEHLQAVTAYRAAQQGVIDAAVGVAMDAIYAARSARQKAQQDWIAANARCDILHLTLIHQQAASGTAREAVRELERLWKEDAAAGSTAQEQATGAARDSAAGYWNALIA